MRKKMLSLQGLLSVLLLTSVPSWSASPVLDDKDLAEHSDYGFKVGGFIDLTKQTGFKGERKTGMFESLCRKSALASVGFSAFNRMCVAINVGSIEAAGMLAAMPDAPAFKNRMDFTTAPALIWGGKLGVQLYHEGCVRAMGSATYAQSRMPLKMVSGIVSRRHYQLVPSFDTANNRLGLYLVPNVSDIQYVSPTQAFTADSLVISMPHTVYDPTGANLDFSQYELSLLFGYGQQHVMYIGAKLIGGVSSITITKDTITNAIGQPLGNLFEGFLGVVAPDMTKIEGTRESYIAPTVGFCLSNKDINLDVSASWLAQQDLTIRASISF